MRHLTKVMIVFYTRHFKLRHEGLVVVSVLIILVYYQIIIFLDIALSLDYGVVIKILRVRRSSGL